MLFARRLSTLDLNEINALQRMAHTPKKLKHGHIDDDALAFAIFSADGKCCCMMATTAVIFRIAIAEGFDNGYLKDETTTFWRFLWLNWRTASIVSSSVRVGLPRRYGAGDRGGAINAVADRPSLHAADFIVLLHRELRPLKNWRRRYASGRRIGNAARRQRRVLSECSAHWSKRLISF